MAERALRSKKTGKVMTESQLFDYDPMGKGTPAEVFDAYMQTGQYEAVPEPKTVGGFARNALDSTGRLAMDTMSGVGTLVAAPFAATQAAWSALNGGPMPEPPKFGEMWDATKNYVVNRYGSPQKVWDTFYEDPAGVASDAATVLGGVSGIAKGGAKLAGKVGAVGAASRAANVASKAKTAADMVDPLTAVTKVPQAAMNAYAAARGTTSPAYKAGARMYGGILGPRTAGMDLDEVEAMTHTGLANEITINKRGARKAKEQASVIDAFRDAEVSAASAGGATVDPRNAVQGALKYRRKVAGPLGEPKKGAIGSAGENAARAIDTEVDKFMTNHGGVQVDPKTGAWGPAQPLTLEEANEAKKATYQVLGDSKYDVNQQPVAVEAQKKLVRGLKEAIDAIIPKLKEQGIVERDLLNLVDSIQNAVKRGGTKNIAGQSFYSTGQGINFLAGNLSPSGGAAVFRTVMDVAPGFVSKLAIAIARDHTVASRLRSKLNAASAVGRVKRENRENAEAARLTSDDPYGEIAEPPAPSGAAPTRNPDDPYGPQ